MDRDEDVMDGSFKSALGRRSLNNSTSCQFLLKLGGLISKSMYAYFFAYLKKKCLKKFEILSFNLNADIKSYMEIIKKED